MSHNAILLYVNPSENEGKGVYDVRRHKRVFSEPLCRNITRERVNVNSERRRVKSAERNSENNQFDDNKTQKDAQKGMDVSEKVSFTSVQMLCTPAFWLAFICISFLAAVGSSVISFARDLALSVGAGASFATTLVGVLAVCNGLGRIITGAVFDSLGRRFTMIGAGVLTVFAAGVTLLAVGIGSLPLCIVGLCLTGLSYGTSPTVSSAFTSAFYGQKHFATNLSISNFNLMLASFIATACSSLKLASGGYTAPFILLLSLSVVALLLNVSIKKP